MSRRVLFIEADASVRLVYTRLLRAAGFDVTPVASITAAPRARFDVVVADDGGAGKALHPLRVWALQQLADAPPILLSASWTGAPGASIPPLNYRVLSKPCTLEDLVAAIGGDGTP